MSDIEETYEYTVTLGVGLSGSSDEVEYSLQEFGYSDQEWDALSISEQNYAVDEMTEEHVRNTIDTWGEVHCG